MSLCLELEEFEDFLVKISHKKQSQRRLLIIIKTCDITVKGERVMVDFKKVGQFVDFEVKILDSHKPPRPAKIDGEITVANSNEIAGGVSFDQVTRTGKLTCLDEGIGQVAFTADADLGAGVKPIAATLDFTGPDLSEATVFDVTVGPIQDPPV